MTKEGECILDLANAIAKDWQNRHEEVSWEEDRNNQVVFTGICPIDGSDCQVLINISNGKIDGAPRIIIHPDNCDKKD